MFYGGDYNPEQWTAPVWHEDIALMRAAGVTLVTVGVFAWSALERAPGRYDFGWLDTVLDGLADAGIRVALATPTAAPPPWFSRRHPESLPVGPDGVRLSPGSRDTYCASAPAYRAAARRIALALGARYGGHPALALWRVHNEYGTTCYCDLTAAAFRAWLQRRYGSLDALNDAWTTAFWSQRYGDWELVLPPRRTQYLANPTQVLDFRRFTSDELLDAYREQRDVLRAAAPGIPVTTNYVLGDWVPVDHVRWSREVDLVAVDHYPSSSGPSAEEEAAFLADLARGWSGDKGWLLMESAPNLIYTPGRMHTKEPGRMTRQALAAVARGSRGAMFFQWRASRGGAELFHSALVPHAGTDSRVFREALALGPTLARTTEVLGAAVEARVAVGYHEPSAWALAATVLPSDAVDHRAEARHAHRALSRLGITCDVVGDLDDLSRYAVLVLPCWYLLTDSQAAELTAWVTGGGRLVVTYLSGVADEHARVRLGGYPGALRELLGVRVEEFHPLASGWSETVHLAGAVATVFYAGGGPAVTRHRVGSGDAWYVSTRLADDAYADLLGAIATEAGVAPVRPRPPAGVEVVRRTAGDRSWLFAINHGEMPYDLRAEGIDLLTGETVTWNTVLRPGAAMVVREASASARSAPGVGD
ncbi:beta-galactosidase [Asanoa ishikariensis]|uniref:Beta-galactosidase n=1 Tax=Asanoa ishikariensis TaxID=137265 RepID=A0A1H3SZ88_9ACTN|nr:beta-galactosidase [Asanoa ishikariensis]GIF63218.1 beta-galactosidase [Asanoa ishikariensis]SDZ43302.1 beta-galactosidase [Asanoa ishikariensis]